jgi:hypothetical protein
MKWNAGESVQASTNGGFNKKGVPARILRYFTSFTGAAEQNYETFRGLVLNVESPECEAIMHSTARNMLKWD